MCLVSNRKEPFIAEKDIVVYKFLYKENGKYFAPYVMDKEIKYEYHYGLNAPHGNKDNVFIISFQGIYYIGAGWLHSFKNKEDAFRVDKNIVVAKMIIPKGSEYFESKNGKELCSNRLRWPIKNYILGNVFKLYSK